MYFRLSVFGKAVPEVCPPHLCARYCGRVSYLLNQLVNSTQLSNALINTSRTTPSKIMSVLALCPTSTSFCGKCYHNSGSTYAEYCDFVEYLK